MQNAPHPPWDLPGNIPAPANADTQSVTSWERLRIGPVTPLAAYHLRSWLGVFPGIQDFFVTCQSNFRSADVAWFASGMSRDGNHHHPVTSFHPSLVTLVRDTKYPQGKGERKALLTEIKDLMYDVATMYDRLAGSTTMIISSGGTTIPGSPIRPEYLKASVYLPPAFVTHQLDLHRPILDIVQQFIETVGVRTVNMWTQRARRDLGYSLTQMGNPQQNALFNAIPSPEYNSAHYMFLGQPYRFREDPSYVPVQALSPEHSDGSYDYGEDPDPTTLAILDLQEQNSDLQEQVRVLQQHISDPEEQVSVSDLRNSSLALQCQRGRDRIAFLEAQVQGVPTDRNRTTPSQNEAAHHARATPQSTPLRYAQVTPSRAPLTRAQTPSGYGHPAPQTPDTPSRRHVQSPSGTPAISRTLYSASRTAQTSPSASRTAQASLSASHTIQVSSSREASNVKRLLPHYINLYELRHLSGQLNLIANYTPAENRIQELTNIGLDGEVCQQLAETMALDKGELLPATAMPDEN
ncbi:hypothetical protein BDZ97DRAFT_1928514 [Flammula alnicola]|nr:hypothetical protein BDZ97DRAFT_1928514 [Flammula alnicola]